MNGPALKPCPFCGLDDLHLTTTHRGFSWVMCGGCRVETYARNSPELAADAWNTRWRAWQNQDIKEHMEVRTVSDYDVVTPCGRYTFKAGVTYTTSGYVGLLSLRGPDGVHNCVFCSGYDLTGLFKPVEGTP